jgi:hypothetical protein
VAVSGLEFFDIEVNAAIARDVGIAIVYDLLDEFD